MGTAPQAAPAQNDRSNVIPLPGNHPSTINGEGEASPTALEVHKIFVTIFPNIKAQTGKYGSLTLRELGSSIANTTARTKEELPMLKLQRFSGARTDKNCLRSDAAVVEIFGCEGEHDAGTMTFTAATEALHKANIRGIVYTSPSYIPATRERWRVLLPTSQPLAPSLRSGLVARLNGILGGVLAPTESFTLSQSFYYGSVDNNPNHQVRILDGDFIDQRPDLDPGAIFKSGHTATASGQPAGEREPSEPWGDIVVKIPGRRHPAPQPGQAVGQAGEIGDGPRRGRELPARAAGSFDGGKG